VAKVLKVNDDMSKRMADASFESFRPKSKKLIHFLLTMWNRREYIKVKMKKNEEK
jgi:hypothetical protein